MLWVLLASTLVGESAERLTLCQLKADPARYQHKLVEITAFLTHGFEDFSLFDPACETAPGVWLEYGGTVASGTTYCCGASNNRSRPKPLTVEGITVPLREDEQFRAFARAIQKPRDSIVRATMVGRYFAGREDRFPNGLIRRGGYGHLGCCTLLVIEQVLAVDTETRRELDDQRWADPPKARCYRDLVPREYAADLLKTELHFDTPEAAAADALERFGKIKTAKPLKRIRRLKGRTVFDWRARGRRFQITTNRPYWLAFSGKTTPWVAISVIEITC